ncbi:hypothetical protein D4764_05G0000460 [Takifugu flavidus]|uniref:Integrase-type domain-containing protein n=1 Tax=Takifugu flavidus TaxID=433684 RepID=A0A5C6MY30_9TELE|nr:hypothetical protein D4764_05G0000460 [Takifugu flavidus]
MGTLQSKDSWKSDAGPSASLETTYPPPYQPGTTATIGLTRKRGHYVVIKDFRRTRWNQKRWQGPLQILLVTQTAVKVAERATWIHASHCKKVPSRRSRCASGTAHLFIPQVCLLPNTWATVIVPLSSISNLENTAAGLLPVPIFSASGRLIGSWRHQNLSRPPGVLLLNHEAICHRTLDSLLYSTSLKAISKCTFFRL